MNLDKLVKLTGNDFMADGIINGFHKNSSCFHISKYEKRVVWNPSLKMLFKCWTNEKYDWKWNKSCLKMSSWEFELKKLCQWMRSRWNRPCHAHIDFDISNLQQTCLLLMHRHTIMRRWILNAHFIVSLLYLSLSLFPSLSPYISLSEACLFFFINSTTTFMMLTNTMHRTYSLVHSLSCVWQSVCI